MKNLLVFCLQRSLYKVNICSPVNNSPNETNKCPSGLIGACETGVSQESAKNLGYLTSIPKVNKDKTITILYTGKFDDFI